MYYSPQQDVVVTDDHLNNVPVVHARTLSYPQPMVRPTASAGIGVCCVARGSRCPIRDDVDALVRGR